MFTTAAVCFIAVLLITSQQAAARTVIPRREFGLDGTVTGQGVRVATFDTGIAKSHAHFKKVNLKRCEAFTTQDTCEDGFGHGSFVAGTIASSSPECPGIAPRVELSTFKVFTDGQASFTTWFLDALNSALPDDIDVANLSIGGPDYFDRPFVDKINEASAAGLTIVTAIGNDGPHFGSCFNPGDQVDVVAVGAHVANKDRLALFSARGLTSWEMPGGIGRPKPDVVTYGESLLGTNHRGGCKELSGTSVAAPVVTGVLALVSEKLKANGVRPNPGLLKQILIETAVPIRNTCRPCVKNMFPRLGATVTPVMKMADLPYPSVVRSLQDIDDALEESIAAQGAGAVSAKSAIALAETLDVPSVTLRVSLHPSAVNLSPPCRYMWPFCDVPLFHTSQALALNVTILLAGSSVGELDNARTADELVDADVTFDDPAHGSILQVQWAANRFVWPWAGALAVVFNVQRPVKAETVVSGSIKFHVFLAAGASPYGLSEQRQAVSVLLPFTVVVQPTPVKAKRVLWDTMHSVQYPPAFIPRDDLEEQVDLLDWHGDSPYANYRQAFNALQRAGYFVEVPFLPQRGLASIDLALYGTVLIVEPEDYFYLEELDALRDAVMMSGTSIVVFADWFDRELTSSIAFTDDNTGDFWEPATGGANVLSINMLLHPFGVELGSTVWAGSFRTATQVVSVKSGNSLYRVPAHSAFCTASRLVDMSTKIRGRGAPERGPIAMLSLVDATEATMTMPKRPEAGRVVTYGDSGCLDGTHAKNQEYCLDLLLTVVGYAAKYASAAEAMGALQGESFQCKSATVEMQFQAVKRTRPLSREDVERWQGDVTIDPLLNISTPLRNQLRLPTDGSPAFMRARRVPQGGMTFTPLHRKGNFGFENSSARCDKDEQGPSTDAWVSVPPSVTPRVVSSGARRASLFDKRNVSFGVGLILLAAGMVWLARHRHGKRRFSRDLRSV